MCKANFQNHHRQVVKLTQKDDKIKRGSGKKLSKGGGMRKLPSTFFPGPMDVICARGAAVYCHPGNRRYRNIIEINLKQYSEARSKAEKSRIVSTIVASIRRASPEGGFVKEEGGLWYEVGDHIAREKVGQSFRDSLHTMYKSSSKAKNSRSKALKSSSKKFQTENSQTIPEQASVTSEQHEIDSLDSILSNELINCDYVKEMYQEFKNEDLDNCDYVNELFQAFRYEDIPTANNSFCSHDEEGVPSIREEEYSPCWRQELDGCHVSTVFSSPLADLDLRYEDIPTTINSFCSHDDEGVRLIRGDEYAACWRQESDDNHVLSIFSSSLPELDQLSEFGHEH